MKVVIFDLGQTLMQYAGMPYSWVDFYYEGFEAMIQNMIAALADLPSAMPDEIFRRDILELLGYFDYYVSSLCYVILFPSFLPLSGFITPYGKI